MSSDGGTTWRSTFDDQPVSSIGSIAVALSDPNIVYVGSGEANIRGNVQDGNGIYKSLDGGKTWSHVWNQVGQIGALAVHPKNPDIAYAAVLGHAFGANPERGIYRTRDGGRTWQQVLKKDADTGASDIAMDPSNPNILFAGPLAGPAVSRGICRAAARAAASTSRATAATPGKQLTGHGLPDRIWGKVGVAVAPSDGRRIYALIEAAKGGLYRSDDGGETWELANGTHALRQRAWYYSTITVNPVNPNDVWFPQVPMLHTIDGGKTIQVLQGSAARRQPRPVDRSAEPEADDRRQRRRRSHQPKRRRQLVLAAAADRAVLPRRRRHPASLLGRRRDAGSRAPPRDRATASAAPSSSAPGTASVAAKRATSIPIRPIPTLSMPASISGSSPATTTAPGRRATSVPGRTIPRATAART